VVRLSNHERIVYMRYVVRSALRQAQGERMLFNFRPYYSKKYFITFVKPLQNSDPGQHGRLASGAFTPRTAKKPQQP
jgi:hypothetical protein